MEPLFIRREIEESVATYKAALEDAALQEAIGRAAEVMTAALQGGKNVFWAGNGGSAADAQHLAAELQGRMNYDRPALSSVALTTNTSTLTAIGNDYGYENVFSRQLVGLGKSGDVFVGFSTSGTSKNIIKAFEVARAQGVVTIGFCGSKTDVFASLCDVVVAAPSARTPKIQEIHIMAGHIVAGLVERAMYPLAEQRAA